jgi:arylsulfatase A-like enzyme
MMNHGFDKSYGIPYSDDAYLWPEDPWYDLKRDMLRYVLESRKGQPVKELEQLTLEVQRNIDVEYMKRSKDSLKRSTDQGKPFFVDFNYSAMNLPTTPRTEFEGKPGDSEWADALLQMDIDFGTLLDRLTSLGVDDNTVVVFSGDNGPRN